MEKLVFLEEYPHKSLAEVTEKVLIANGIECILQSNEVGDALMGGIAVTQGPTNVFVPKEKMESAKKLLAELSKTQ